MSDTKEEAALVGADALTQLTCSLVKSENCVALGSSANRHAKEPHAKVLHSVAGATPSGGAHNHPPASVSVSINVTAPQCGFPRRQLSSSVDGPAPVPTFSQAQVIEECLVVGTESSVCRPTTLSLSREVSTTSSGGSGKTTPCNIPERLGASLQENLVSSYPPTYPPASACVSPMRHGAMAASSVQPQFPLDGDMMAVRRQAMARLIAQRLGVIGDQITSEADMQNVTELLETIVSSNASAWSWSNVARIFRALSHILAKIVSGSDTTAWDVFTDVWKHVLRNLFTLIADHGGWDSFIRWASDVNAEDPAMPPHPTLPTSFTPNVPRRIVTDPAMRYSTPQVSRRNFPTNQSTPSSLNSARGERSSRVLSLTEEGVFQMEAQVLFIAGSNGAELDEEEEATFGSLSSGSDLSASPTSCNPPTGHCSLPVMDLSHPPAFDRSRSRSFPSRKRPSNARFLIQSTGTDCSQVITEQDRSMDSGLEAFSEASLNSADSCTSLHYSRLGVSATCILEAVRSMLIEK